MPANRLRVNVESFLKGTMCEIIHMSKFKPGRVEENSSLTIGSPAGIEHVYDFHSNVKNITFRNYSTSSEVPENHI